jgi:recombinational DNA repair protein (RecF pathway)
MTGLVERDCRALVLSAADSRDDRIVRLLLDSDELVPAFARFARKSSGRGRSPRTSMLQPLTSVHVRLRAKPGAELATIEEVAMDAPFAVIKGDLLRTALASAMCEVVLHLVPDWASESGLHDLLMRALTHLDRPAEKAREALLLLFELRVLDLGGVLPPFEELPELPEETRAALTAWRTGRFLPLADGPLRAAARFLEESLTATSGRPLLSRSLLEAALAVGG